MNAGSELAELARRGQWGRLRRLCEERLAADAADAQALLYLGQAEAASGELEMAERHLAAAVQHRPANDQARVALAELQILKGDAAEAEAALAACTEAENPAVLAARLRLGHLRDRQGDDLGALRAYFDSVTPAQLQGLWVDPDSTPRALLDDVVHAIGRLRKGRVELLKHSFDAARAEFGASELARVDKALAGYLREIDTTPPSPHQRPRFLYIPDLPPGPYHDPRAVPWLDTLGAAFADVRDEALGALREDSHFPDYFNFKPGMKLEDYLGGESAAPAWEALFFYRRGHRFDDNHLRCPRTSAVLESVELCRIEDDAPEICFSVIAPRTELKAHHGVTNMRLVLHLPLLVPEGCALSVAGGGEHWWREGEFMLFDDTYLHSAFNRSDTPRVILLMDLWNPFLSTAEKAALVQLVPTIGRLGRAGRAARA